MQKTSLLGILLLLAILATGVWLLLAPTFSGAPAAGPGDTADSTAATAIAESVDAATAEAPSTEGDPSARVALEAGAAPSATASGLAILGRVVDENGAPLVAATVACSPEMDFDRDAIGDPDLADPAVMMEQVRSLAQQTVEVVTDADGHFRIAPPGKTRALDLSVRARGHVALSHRANRPTKTDVDVGALTLKRGAIVSGRVLDQAGRAVVAASVGRRPKNDQRFGELESGSMFDPMRGGGDDAVTDASGSFELAHVEPGEFSLRARHDDHPAARLDGLTVATGKKLADLIIVVEPGVVISGRVLGIPEGTKNVRVQAGPRAGGGAGEQPGLDVAERSAATEPDGSFTVRGLGVGRTYRVSATQSGRGFAGNATCTQHIEVASGTQGLELRYEAGVTVTFRVVDAESGAAIERLWVNDQLKGGGGTGDILGFLAANVARSKAYPDGQVTIPNLRPKKQQTMRLRVEALGFAELVRDAIALPEVGALDLGTLRLEPAPVVHVEVSASGKPVAGATVRLRGHREESEEARTRFGMTFPLMVSRGDALSARTDEDGRCAVNGTPGAKVVVSVTSTDHAPYESETLTLAARESLRHHVELLRGGTVEVTVIEGKSGKSTPVADVAVDHTTPGGAHDNPRTDATGKVVFERLAPGGHGFRISVRTGTSSGRDMEFSMGVRMGGGGDQQPSGPGWENVDVVDGAVATVQLVKEPETSMAGIVRENGVALAGAEITWLQGPGEAAPDPTQFRSALDGGRFRNATTDDTGRYRLTELAPGEHRLRITHRERAMPIVVPVNLVAGDNALDQELELTILRGIVRDADGKPIAGAALSATPATSGRVLTLTGDLGASRRSASTGPDGRFELRGIQGGVRVTVRAEAKGFAPASFRPVEVARGGANDTVDIQLVAAGSLRVKATVEGSFDVVAHATWAGADGQVVESDGQLLRNGVATFAGLRPGRWKIALTSMRQAHGEPRFAEVIAGQTAEVSF